MIQVGPWLLSPGTIKGGSGCRIVLSVPPRFGVWALAADATSANPSAARTTAKPQYRAMEPPKCLARTHPGRNIRASPSMPGQALHPGGSPMTIADKTVLVTGATDGVGRLVARELARAGARVLLHGRRQ